MRLAKGWPSGASSGQLDDTFVLVGDTHLPLGDEHAVRFLAADLARFERHVGAGDIAAHRCKDAFHAGPRIGRAADDLDLLFTGIDNADLKPVCIRMLLPR